MAQVEKGTAGFQMFIEERHDNLLGVAEDMKLEFQRLIKLKWSAKREHE